MARLNTKTIVLTGTEQAVKLSGQNCDIRNDGADMVYASGEAGIVAGADGVMSIPAGQAVKLLDVGGTVYLLGTGSVQVCGNDYAQPVFKTAATSSGEGGGTDDVARQAISSHAGNSKIHVTAEERAVWNGKAELSDIPTSLPANGGNADTLDGLHANEIASNPNLLINPDFEINQRGQTEYNTDGYTVDRWTGYSECPIKVVLNDGYISVIPLGGGTGDEYSFTQKLEEIGVLGKTLTFSICAKGSGIAKIGDYYSLKDISLTDQFVVYKHTFVFSDYTNSAIGVWLFGADNQIDIAWAKLELGSVATPFVPPDPATELAKCQRYYYNPACNSTGGAYTAINRTGSGLVMVLPLPVPMRVQPTASLDASGNVSVEIWNDNDVWEVVTATNSFIMGNIYSLEFGAVDSCTQHKNYLLRNLPTLSAEL